MRTSVIVTTLACLLGLTGLAQAATLASPAIFGGFAQDRAQCLIGNIGTTAVSVTVRILDESGNTVAGGTPTTVPPGSAFSVFAAPIGFGVAYACSATAGTVTNLRGTLILLDTVDPGDFEPVRSVELR